MRIDVITAFPKILEEPLNESILKQAQRRLELAIRVWDLREFATDKHRTIDDTPYGGGAGMVLKPAPLFAALEAVLQEAEDLTPRIVFPTPQGKPFSQEIAQELSEVQRLIFICGHYKGVDQRVVDTWVTDEISVGDFVLSGGEIPALLMIDSIVRLIPGAINDIESAKSDSFQDGLLDCPYYTRPETFRGLGVPAVLLSGHHQKIARWRQNERLTRTEERRPGILYEQYVRERKTQNEKKDLNKIRKNEE